MYRSKIKSTILSSMVSDWGYDKPLEWKHQVVSGECPCCRKFSEKDDSKWRNALIGFRKNVTDKYSGLVILECPKCSEKIWQFIHETALSAWSRSKAWKGPVSDVSGNSPPRKARRG